MNKKYSEPYVILTKEQYKILRKFLVENKFQYKKSKNGKVYGIICPKPSRTIHNWQIIDWRDNGFNSIGNVEFKKNGKIDCILRKWC